MSQKTLVIYSERKKIVSYVVVWSLSCFSLHLTTVYI